MTKARPGSSLAERPAKKSKAAAATRPSTPKAVGVVEAEWTKLLCALPGYDPFRAAGQTWFDAALASRAIAFIEECCRHVEGALAGRPLKLEAWQKAFVANLFGWLRTDEQGRTVRRYREALLYVPRKNGKTPLAAAIALYVLFCDAEAGQQGYIAAKDREQAGMLFRQLKGMVEQESELSERCDLYGGRAEAGQSKSVVLKRDGSFLRVISADADSKHGGNTHLAIIDELHAQPNRDLVDVLATSMASANRAQPLLLHLTTADHDRPSICNEKHEYACKVRDGLVDDLTFLPAVFEITKDDDWRKPEVWAKANPNLGVSVSREYLEREAGKAVENLAYQATFRRLHLNQKTESSTAAIDLALWDAQPRITAADLAGCECWASLDLSTTTDLTALALVFRLDAERWASLVRLWAPRAKARHRSRADRVPYEAWAEAGLLTLTEGDVVDYEAVRRELMQLASVYRIRKVAADPWNASHLLTQLAGDGFDIERFGQGYRSMTAPTKELLALIAQRRLAHEHSAAMRWQAGNLVTESDAAENLKPSKAKSSDRIDGMVATIMGLGVALTAPSGGSVYDTQGVLTL